MDITGPHGEGPFTVHELWIEQASDIAAEYYASFILDRGEKKVMAMLSRMGGMDVEEIAEEDPDALVKEHVDPLKGFSREDALAIASKAKLADDAIEKTRGAAGQAQRGLQQGRRDPDRGQPADRHLRP